jgi:hypothetical protein
MLSISQTSARHESFLCDLVFLVAVPAVWFLSHAIDYGIGLADGKKS